MIKWVGEKAYLGTRQLGFRRGDEFHTFRVRNLHYFRNFKGYGISAELLDDLKKKQVKLIIIIMKFERMRLTASVDTWLNNGSPYQHKDYEPQIILNEDNFSLTGFT